MKGVKKLENWVTFPEAARILGVSKQGFHKMVDEQGLIPVNRIRAIGDKPTYIVETDAVYDLKRQREVIAKVNADLKAVLEDII